MDRYTFISNSPAATSGLGRRIGERIRAGSVIGLIGELGCGKTLLTRGICTGLGVSSRQVNSPTFLLVNEYDGRLPVFHMDVYRLEEIAEGFEIGLLDYLERAGAGVMVVEWAEKILTLLPDDYLKVEFQILSVRRRQLVITAQGDKYTSLFKEMGKR